MNAFRSGTLAVTFAAIVALTGGCSSSDSGSSAAGGNSALALNASLPKLDLEVRACPTDDEVGNVVGKDVAANEQNNRMAQPVARCSYEVGDSTFEFDAESVSNGKPAKTVEGALKDQYGDDGFTLSPADDVFGRGAFQAYAEPGDVSQCQVLLQGSAAASRFTYRATPKAEPDEVCATTSKFAQLFLSDADERGATGFDGGSATWDMVTDAGGQFTVQLDLNAAKPFDATGTDHPANGEHLDGYTGCEVNPGTDAVISGELTATGKAALTEHPTFLLTTGDGERDLAPADVVIEQVYSDGPVCRDASSAEGRPFAHAAWDSLEKDGNDFARVFIIVHNYYDENGSPVDPKRLDQIGLFPKQSKGTGSTVVSEPATPDAPVLTLSGGQSGW